MPGSLVIAFFRSFNIHAKICMCSPLSNILNLSFPSLLSCLRCGRENTKHSAKKKNTTADRKIHYVIWGPLKTREIYSSGTNYSRMLTEGRRGFCASANLSRFTSRALFSSYSTIFLAVKYFQNNCPLHFYIE